MRCGYNRGAMNSVAMRKARVQLESAQASLNEFAVGGSYKEMERHWTNFLAATYRVYEALAAGVDVVEPDRSWWATAKQERREDPLLNYLHAARNANEHTLALSTARGEKAIRITGRDGSTLNIATNSDAISLGAPEGVNREVIVTPPSLVLAAARLSRSGSIVQPPTEHKGVSLSDCSPMGVGKFAIEYLSALIDGAPSTLRR